MAHYAKIVNGVVDQVIVADENHISTLTGIWVQTSYNTRHGVHYGQDGNPDSGIALRKNYARRGDTYDSARDAFIAPQPFPSWILDESTCDWVPPTQCPNDGKTYKWNEDLKAWQATNQSVLIMPKTTKPATPPKE